MLCFGLLTGEKMKKHIHVGMDVGASAVKCIVLDTGGKILWRQYIHHDCRVVETVERVMTDLVAAYEGNEVFLCMTGQGGRKSRNALACPLYRRLLRSRIICPISAEMWMR